MGSAEPELVAVVGATGTGKSDFSLDLAGALAASGLRAEIVNADAMQLYRGMDIGTAKLPVAARRGIPHHLIDVLDPTDEASVAAYQEAARSAILDVQGRGAMPILVGGSGLYVSSVLFDFRFPGTDQVVRQRLEAELLSSGPDGLFARLREVDPEAAQAIGPHNGRRIVRALEVVEITGRPFGAGLPAESRPWTPATVLGLVAPRDRLVARLDARVERMWADGLLDEVRALMGKGLGVTAARAIGYAQAIAHLTGELSRAEAIGETAALTRKYARRQVGWFRRYPRTTWFDHDDPTRVESALQLLLNHA
ncbi:MAG TPA: tRNA (adenosine(37)-N6)-dimethylallyltransferase MiaA [Lacisediminihabitans sp.]|uniref:tRNA (adenosine(37)-N6)-dimethylallyltransferase MiaA n=1 Tax=Lacisediminihabitans sp. TaxID=2787631 RepID=UPI002ED7AFF9